MPVSKRLAHILLKPLSIYNLILNQNLFLSLVSQYREHTDSVKSTGGKKIVRKAPEKSSETTPQVGRVVSLDDEVSNEHLGDVW